MVRSDAPETVPAAGEPVVLVVDDDRMFTTLLAAQLDARGYPTAEASSVDSARQAVQRLPQLRAVVCDGNLPGDGLALVTDLAAQRPDLVVVVVSGLGRSTLDERGLPARVPSMQKPVGSEELIALIASPGGGGTGPGR